MHERYPFTKTVSSAKLLRDARPDPKPAPVVRDPALLTALHARGGVCALADATCERVVSLHHVSKHPKDDVRANLVWLCGSGTTGHHGRVEAWDAEVRARLGGVLRTRRPDVTAYLAERLGGAERAAEFLQRQYGA